MAYLSKPKKFATRTEEINSLFALKGVRNYEAARALEIRSEYLSMMKSGVMAFPREKAGQLAEILGTTVDHIIELFALEEHNYQPIHG